ncbi:hypothetical protein Taiwan41_01040 [Helicobacter pylori]
MGIETKNLGFGFALILIIKTLKGVLKYNIKELTQTQAIIFKALLGDLMGLKECYFKIPLSALKNNFTTK